MCTRRGAGGFAWGSVGGLTCERWEMGVSVGEMEARKELDSPPNRCWPNHHREFFAFGTEKRDELCVREKQKTVFV